MRLVLDTSVLAAAMRSQAGASRQLLILALQRQYEMLASVPLMIEYEAVLTRPEHLEASAITAADVQVVLDAVASVAEPIRLVFLWRPVSSDPAHDMVIETAVNGRAAAIVTFNERHLEAATSRFGIEVATPSEIFRRLKDR